MPTLFIANMAVQVPSRFAEGDILGENAANILNHIHQNRIRGRLRGLVEKGDISPEELQAKADEIASQEMVPYMTTDDDEESDPIMEEALSIARDLIIERMAKEGLLPPKGLNTHARALVNAMPQIQEKARLRIEARFAAASQALGVI